MALGLRDSFSTAQHGNTDRYHINRKNSIMLTEYQITNFKSLASATIPIKPITLIFGPNSSGKSSILQSLLVLKQSIKNDSGLLTQGDLIDIGNYFSMIHKHDINKNFSFKITLLKKDALLELTPELDCLPEGNQVKRDDLNPAYEKYLISMILILSVSGLYCHVIIDYQ